MNEWKDKEEEKKNTVIEWNVQAKFSINIKQEDSLQILSNCFSIFGN